MTTVFVTQEIDGRDFFPARKFGTLELILPSTAQVVLSVDPTLRKIRRALKDFSDNDFLLLSGDPIIMGLCMMVASDINRGKVQTLKWDKREKDYYPVKVDFYGKEKEYV
jgi:hypothetical protein